MPETLTISLAKQIAARAVEAAVAIPCAMTIAIVDNGANLMYLERMDGALIAGAEVARRKARSAVLYNRPTKVFEDALAGGRMAIMSLPDAVPLEGGIPIIRDDHLLGAIGVSGGTAPQDGQVASAALHGI